jgi:hypothetical protein
MAERTGHELDTYPRNRHGGLSHQLDRRRTHFSIFGGKEVNDGHRDPSRRNEHDGSRDLAIMRTFEEEEAYRYRCDIVERQEDARGFVKWEEVLPDLRTHAGHPIDDLHTPAPGETDLPQILREDL